jgi:hypothetical protein
MKYNTANDYRFGETTNFRLEQNHRGQFQRKTDLYTFDTAYMAFDFFWRAALDIDSNF